MLAATRRLLHGLHAPGPVPLGRTSAIAHSRAVSTGPRRAKTGVLMLNMGGPSMLDEVGSFLGNLFADREIIQLGPLQNILVRGEAAWGADVVPA